MADPLLDISTVIERPAILVDGARYEILSPDEVSLVDYHRFMAWGKTINRLMGSDGLDDAQLGELMDAVYKLTDRIMVGVPSEVRDRMNDEQRVSVAEVFMRLKGKEALAEKAPAKKANRKTGVKSSPASSVSTGATPDGG